MASIKVFGSPASTEVARVLTCLMEKEVDFQLIRVDTFKGKQPGGPDQYIRVNDPADPVTYKEGSKTLTRSREICRYISEKFVNQGNKDLIGAGTLERASIEQWLQTEESSFHPPSAELILHLAFSPQLTCNLEQQSLNVEKHAKRLARVLDVYEEQLGETKFLAGDEFTLADLSHLPNAEYLMKTDFGKDMFMMRRNVSKWWEAISNRKSWKMVTAMQGDYSLLSASLEM